MSVIVCESVIFFTESVANAFSSPDGTTFDFVINCASETKLAQTEAVSLSLINLIKYTWLINASENVSIITACNQLTPIKSNQIISFQTTLCMTI